MHVFEGPSDAGSVPPAAATPSKVALIALHDNDTTLEITLRLRIDGYDVCRCRTESEVLDALGDALLQAQKRPAVIVVEIGMYRRDGPHLRALLHRLPWTVPILVHLREGTPFLRQEDHGLVVFLGAKTTPLEAIRRIGRHCDDLELQSFLTGDEQDWSASPYGADRRYAANP